MGMIGCSSPSGLILSKLFTSLSLSTFMGGPDGSQWIVRMLQLESVVVTRVGTQGRASLGCQLKKILENMVAVSPGWFRGAILMVDFARWKSI